MIIGDKHEFLTITKILPRGMYECTCECGNKRVLNKNNFSRNKSCGCYNQLMRKSRSGVNSSGYKHGKSKHKLYAIYKSIRKKSEKERVVLEWKTYLEFFDWAIQSWAEGLVLNRLELSNGFSSSNCYFGKRLVRVSQQSVAKNKQTCLARYGVESYTQTQEYLDKCKRTSLEKYGTKWSTQSEHTKAKIKQTVLNKYGVDSVLKYPDIKNRIKNTNLNRYGVEYPGQSEEIKEKIKHTSIKNGHTKSFRGLKPSELAKELGIHATSARARIRKFGDSDLVLTPKNETVIENIVKSWLEKENIHYEQGKRLGEYFYDFKVGKTIIECDGLYWHSDAVNPDNSYHKNKLKFYEDNGYRGLFFREHEILNQFPIVSSIIKNCLGMSNKVYARKCRIIFDIPTHFFSSNHLMGVGVGKSIGLEYNGEIVCGLRYIKKKSHIEISRFCTKLEINVVGGLSRLLNQIKERPIISFVDRRYGNGKSLETLGFTKETEYLSFKWTKDEKVANRMVYPGTSGYDLGWNRIWDCGQAKYLLLK